MDVLTSFASTVHPDGEQDCSVQLLEYLGARRRKHAKKLNATIGKSGTAMRNHLKQISRNLERELGNNSQGDKAASGQATASALTIQSQLMNPARLGRNNLHPYRLKVKEMRNILKLAANPGDQEFADWLGKVKDAIGEWHDWGELQAIARDVLEHGSACKLLREIKRIGDEKYEEALRETENMRAKFLSSRKKKHPGQPADEVWEATRALAA
jgi:CHAD domain-containing protein